MVTTQGSGRKSRVYECTMCGQACKSRRALTTHLRVPPVTSPTRATHAARPSRRPAISRCTFGCTPATSPTRATHAARLFPVHLVSKSTCASIADRTHTYGIKSICRVLLARHAFPIFRLARSGRGSASGRWCRRFFRQESAQVLWHHVAVLWQMSMNIRFLSLSECVQA